MSCDDAEMVIREAERTVYMAGWRLQEETVLQLLAHTRGRSPRCCPAPT
ncbi:MAG TPA: hypothetical protein VLW50_02495 [Streptosporangiaceae bacterium]|nr:hypothetical protein [Streptosporangiaceae bacterium]